MLNIVRPKNLLLIGLLQSLVLMRLGDNNYFFYDISKTIYLLLSTSLVAAAGYIINDYFDVKIDLINKPDKVIVGHHLSRRWAIILHISFTAGGLFLASLVNLKTVGMTVVCAGMLYFYSSTFKKQFLLGNIIIALLAAFSVIICKLYIGWLDGLKTGAYAFFAAFTTFIREIIKDIEDEKGDSQFQSNSLAIHFGLRRTKKILISATILLIMAVGAYPALALDIVYDIGYLYYFYTAWLTVSVCIPLIYLLSRLRKADKMSDFKFLSRLMKFIMFAGITSIMFS